MSKPVYKLNHKELVELSVLTMLEKFGLKGVKEEG